MRKVLIPRYIRSEPNHCREECYFWNDFEGDAYCTLLGSGNIVALNKSEKGWERSQACFEAEEKARGEE